MTRLPSTRPVRLAQQICRLAGIAYLMIGIAIVTILVGAPSLGSQLTGGQAIFTIEDGVWTSSALWWDGILNPLFHGLVFFVLASALGYLADLGETLAERDADDALPYVVATGTDIPELTEDDLLPLK